MINLGGYSILLLASLFATKEPSANFNTAVYSCINCEVAQELSIRTEDAKIVTCRFCRDGKELDCRILSETSIMIADETLSMKADYDRIELSQNSWVFERDD